MPAADTRISNLVANISRAVGDISKANTRIGKAVGDISKVNTRIGKHDADISKADGDIGKRGGRIGKADSGNSLPVCSLFLPIWATTLKHEYSIELNDLPGTKDGAAG